MIEYSPEDIDVVLSKKLNHLFSSGMFSDISLVIKFSDGELVKETVFPVHSLVLKIASPVFVKMLEGDFQEKKSHKIVVEDVHPDIFLSFLKFIYFEKMTIGSSKEAWELYAVALKYLVVPLQNRCIKYIEKYMSETTAIIGYENADFFELEKIKRQAHQIIQAHPYEALSTAEFLDVKESTVAIILDDQELHIPEISLFNYVHDWYKAEISRRCSSGEEEEAAKRYLCEFIVSKIRFHYMSIREFIQGPCKTTLLTLEQKLSHVSHIVLNDSKPSGFYPPLRRKRVPFYKPRLETLLQEKNDDNLFVFSCNYYSDELLEAEFFKNSYVEIPGGLTVEAHSTISFYFMTSCPDGVLFLAGNRDEKISDTNSLPVYSNSDSDYDAYLSIKMQNGFLRTKYKFRERTYKRMTTNEVISPTRLDDGSPHQVTVVFSSKTIMLIDLKVSTCLGIKSATINIPGEVFIGGLTVAPTYGSLSALSKVPVKNSSSEKNGFEGCIARVELPGIGMVDFSNYMSSGIKPCYCDLLGKYCSR